MNETTSDNTEKCIRQLAAYGAVCLTDNNNRSPVDVLLDKNRISDAETLIQLTCMKISILLFFSHDPDSFLNVTSLIQIFEILCQFSFPANF